MASAPISGRVSPFHEVHAIDGCGLDGDVEPQERGDNTVSPMRRLGLIDEDGALTARGNTWRVDASYADACQEIINDVYPADLLALTDAVGAPDPQRIRNWFDHKGYGDSNARQMGSTYVMIASKERPEAGSSEPTKALAKKSAPKKATPTSKAAATPNATRAVGPKEGVPDERGRGPNVHFDIQIHIPADASPEQIDQIFESMARHLYKQ